LLHGIALAVTRLWQSFQRSRKRTERAWSRPIRVLATYQFICLTWIFFRAPSLSGARDLLARIGSLSLSFENVTFPLATVLLSAAALHFVPKKQYLGAMNAFALRPAWVHAGALFLVAVVIQFLAGHANAPFVYSRF